jgi:hypothetical protein
MCSIALYTHMRRRFPLTREEKERKVIELSDKGMNIRQISKRVHMNFGDIGEITRKYSGDEYGIERSKKYSKHSQALELFQRGDTNLGIAIKLGLTYSETIEEHKQYMQLIGSDKFCEIYDEMKGDLESHISLYQELKMAGLSARDAIEGVRYARQLNLMKFEYYRLLNDLVRVKQEFYSVSYELEALKQEKSSLRNQVEVLKEMKDAIWNKMGILPRPEELSQTVRFRRRRFRHARAIGMPQEKGSTL